VGGQQVRWHVGGTELAGEYRFFTGKGNDLELGTGIFVHKRITSAVNMAPFVSVRLSYIILRVCWCHIIVMKVHASTEGKIDDVKDSFYEELECVFV
jgi:hypothetical protein